MTYDVIVVGAGVIGALTARELARYHLKILVLESQPDVAMGATKANSAIVHGGFAEGKETLKGQLCASGRRAFAGLEAELNFGYRETGSLVLDFGGNSAALQALLQKGNANGVTDLELWSANQVREHEPHLNPDVRGGLWCAGAGVCSPWDLTIAALENAVDNGVELRLNEKVVAVNLPAVTKGPWRLLTSTASYETRFVINAAGLRAGQLDALVGLLDSTITPRSGEYLVLAAGTGSLVNSVLFQIPGPMGKGVLVAPTYQNNLMLGPDARSEEPLGDPDRSPEWRHTHRERLAQVVAQARQMLPSLDLKKAIRSFTGLRASAPGGDFLVGPAQSATHPGWHRAAGIQSPGLTSSPVIARLLVQGMAAEGLKLVPRRDFDPYRSPLPSHLSRRPALLPFAQADALTRLPPGDPERVVCRCEQVRERDLDEAFNRPLPCTTVDALKRRTRAGMGWCQGNFCRPRVASWLEDRLKTPVSHLGDAAVSGFHRVEGRDLWTLAESPEKPSPPQ